MKRNEATRAAAIPPTLDSLIEDVFGLNLRGLKTLGHLFAAPKVVFESARVADWHNRYTPTIRLTFSIITVFMLLSFFWAAEDGVFYQSILAQLEDAAASNPDMPPPEQVLESYFAAYSVAYPFVYMFIHTLIASVVWLWGKGTGWVARVRLYFGLLAVGMIIALLSMIFMPLIEREILSIYMLIVMGSASWLMSQLICAPCAVTIPGQGSASARWPLQPSLRLATLWSRSQPGSPPASGSAFRACDHSAGWKSIPSVSAAAISQSRSWAGRTVRSGLSLIMS